VQEKIMKRSILAILFLSLVVQAHGSEIVPPRIAVKWLVQAVQQDRTNSVTYHFAFIPKEHKKLTPLTRKKQLALLKDISIKKLKFDKDEYALDKGKRFVVKLLAPETLEFEMQHVDLKGDIGPPLKYVVIAIRKTAQQKTERDK
jgi:hypothetical protein